MVCFEVTVNQEAPVVAGGADLSVVSVIASYVATRNELELEVGGFAHRSGARDENLRWLSIPLRVGDCVTLRVVEATAASEPVERQSVDAELVEKARRRYYEQLRQEYEG